MKKLIILLIFIAPSISAEEWYPHVPLGKLCNTIGDIDNNLGSNIAGSTEYGDGLTVFSVEGKFYNRNAHIIYLCRYNILNSVSYNLKQDNPRSALKEFEFFFSRFVKKHGKPIMNGATDGDGNLLGLPKTEKTLEIFENMFSLWSRRKTDINLKIETIGTKSEAPVFILTVSYSCRTKVNKLPNKTFQSTALCGD